MRTILSILATLFAFVPGLLLGYEISQWAAPMLCPTPNGPNLCALLGSFAIMGLSAFGMSLIAGGLVWRMVPPPD